MHTVSAIVLPMCEEKGIPLQMHFPEEARASATLSRYRKRFSTRIECGSLHRCRLVAIGCSEISADRCEFWVETPALGSLRKYSRDSATASRQKDEAPFLQRRVGAGDRADLVEAMGSTLEIDTGSDGTRFSFILKLSPTH